jgi:hypothetical protein
MDPSTVLPWIKDNAWNLLGLLDLLIGLVGFTFAIIELRKTRNALEASQEATRQTLQNMSDRFTISDISLILGSLREIQVALRGNRLEAALIRTQETRKYLQQLKSRRGFTSNERRVGIQGTVLHLAKLQDRMEKKLAEPNANFSIPNANLKLSALIDLLSEWAEEIRFTQRNQNGTTTDRPNGGPNH